jgi:hypothetical protein
MLESFEEEPPVPTDRDPLPSVPDKQEVSAEELEQLARIIQEKVVKKVSEQTRDQQDDVERARTWYVG